MIVDIVCSVYNGARYLPEFLQSLERQTHAGWRLWVRDDGSVDDTIELIRAAALNDARLHLWPTDNPPLRLGVAASFGWLLDHVPADSAYVMFADQDDVWLPQKIERTLAAMRAAESSDPSAPILVHGDLVVTDASLRVRHPSFWTFAGLDPEPRSLRRIVVQNPITGAATMINRALRALASPIPIEAPYHDWWCALVAMAFGRIVALREPTILYRQHGANAVGAQDARLTLSRLPAVIVSRLGTGARFRKGVAQSAAQSGALLTRYGHRLGDVDRRFLSDYAQLPQRAFVRRKLDLLRLRRLPEHGLLQTLGVLLRG